MLIRCLDVETTGRDPVVYRVCEIATVDLIRDGGVRDSMDMGRGPDAVPKIERGRMWSTLVNPGMPIPPEASAVHDITDEMVKDASPIENVMPIVIAGKVDYYCAHNSRFDSKFLSLPDHPWLDTYRIALWLWPDAPEHKLATLRYWLKLKLIEDNEDKSKIYRFSRSHSAMWDAYVCASVLRRAFMAGATIEQMVEVSSQPALLPRFTFGKHAMKPIKEVPGDYLDWVLRQDMEEDVKHTAFAELQMRRRLEQLQSSQAPSRVPG